MLQTAMSEAVEGHDPEHEAVVVIQTVSGFVCVAGGFRRVFVREKRNVASAMVAAVTLGRRRRIMATRKRASAARNTPGTPLKSAMEDGPGPSQPLPVRGKQARQVK